MAKYFKYTQSVAAKKLGVSVSTLKRRFYQLDMGKRWPYKRLPNTSMDSEEIEYSSSGSSGVEESEEEEFDEFEEDMEDTHDADKSYIDGHDSDNSTY